MLGGDARKVKGFLGASAGVSAGAGATTQQVARPAGANKCVRDDKLLTSNSSGCSRYLARKLLDLWV